MNKRQDLIYIQRCLELAKKGLGATYPNPMVGAVIVHKGKIIGEGWHKKAGTPHAEVNAIHQVTNKSQLNESTLYVNLEPCSHVGKTPPCADLIIEYRIPRVVIASTDPNPLVSGRGIKKLIASGCKVETHVLHKQSDFLNRRFFTFHQKKRPYIILKWAQTKDSFIAPLPSEKNEAEIFWISNPISKQRVHQWRSEEAAILVGVQTLVQDNPQLTTREWNGKNPLRLVLDPNARSPKKSIAVTDKEPTIFFTKNKTEAFSGIKKQVALNPFSINSILNYCYENQIQSIIVEGGLKTIQSFIDTDMWDEARVFTSEKKLDRGVKAPIIKKSFTQTEQIESDLLSFYFNETFQAKN
ncbi:MAG: bifunctional diaminohydroxyphosphoribosylaminopyrimidine deaminase/5-amino-6-(5-phosphoribosylamino)uracil reductase RibD [Flavobacteriaceae bacterium]|nr:bifunctional diaminohydroxyphosphoribosylaminopyrimidine deaminase/5-amino-6-(5-phosphoribosylamino)uracil reductase RibD [Flavobacteriaceae bacterium]